MTLIFRAVPDLRDADIHSLITGRMDEARTLLGAQALLGMRVSPLGNVRKAKDLLDAILADFADTGGGA